jgi:hypothetical protein
MKAGTEKTKPDPGMMQSIGEHQGVPKEEAAVMPVGGSRRKGSRQVVNPGRNRPSPAGRCPATQEWHGTKRGVFRKDFTRANVERATRRIVSPRKNLQKDRTLRTLKEEVRMHCKGRKGLKDLGGGRPRHLKKRDLKKPQPESTGSVIKTYRKSTGLEISKRIARCNVGLQRIKDWTLWKVRPPSKRKKKLQVEREPVI